MGGERKLIDRLAALADVPDEELDPAEGALLIAGLEHRGLVLEPYWEFLAELRASASIGRDCPSVEERQALLNGILVGRLGFAGDSETYDDPDNADLVRVIDRRKGLPISLGILYIHVARANGWTIHGLAFPRHFLVRLEDAAGRRLIMDPFYGGRLVSPADMRGLLKELVGDGAELTPHNYADVGNRDVLLRLCGNIQLRRMRSGDLAGTLRILEIALLFAPEVASLWREAGLTNLRLGNAAQAVVMLERFLSYDTIAHDEREKVGIILERLYEKPFSER